MQFNKDKLDLRLYQQTILNSAINQNTLVVLPTGLGKTHIAIALSAARLKENSKILVLAPTKPLILQHMQTFSEFFEPADKLALLTGEVSPNERKILWNDSKIIFSTPQTIRNDIIYGQIKLTDVSLIVFDEAHRAIGDYAYVFIAENYAKTAPNSKILALTASPGSEEYKINDVCKNLFIDKIEYRSRDDSEVKDYVKEIEIHYKSVELPDEIIAIKSRLERALQFRIDKLHRYGFLTNKSAIITKKALLHLQLTLRNQYRKKNFAVARGISVCASVIKLKHMLGLAESESLTALNEYFENLLEISKTTKTKAVKELVGDFNVNAAHILTLNALENNIEHPKLNLLKTIIEEQINLKPTSKILVFTEYRANIPKILDTLSPIKMDAHYFIGQGKKRKKVWIFRKLI
ncbi:MAG: DEAD/DEAH box helicase family protein [DPANN group archaeon]|nr:DEAD/DEAH box helicase family protein [DPANN group archaeon]